MKLTVLATLLSVKKDDAENSRTMHTIVLTIPELGWSDLKFKPSALSEMFDIHKANAVLPEDHEEKESNFSKFSRQLKPISEAFYTSREMGWDGFDCIINAVQPILDTLEPASVADPFLKAKRYFAQSAAYANLDFSAPIAAVEKRINEEKAALEQLYRLACSISVEDYKSFVENKVKANGVDKDGYVKLRSKKEEASASSSEGTTED